MNLLVPYNTRNLCKIMTWTEFWPWSHFSYFYNLCTQTKFILKKCTFPTKNFPSSSSLLILLIQSFIIEFAVSLQPVSKSHGITLHRNISTTWGGSCCSSSGKARSWYTWIVRNKLKKIVSSLYMPWRHICTFSTSAVDTADWSAWHPSHYISMQKSFQYPMNRRIGGPPSQFGCFEEELNLLPLQLFELVIHSLS